MRSGSTDRSADLGSIKFILNGGTDAFCEDWAPAMNPRSQSAQLVAKPPAADAADTYAFGGVPISEAVLQEFFGPSFPQDPQRFGRRFATVPNVREGLFDNYSTPWMPFSDSARNPNFGFFQGQNVMPVDSGPEEPYATAIQENLLSHLHRLGLSAEAEQIARSNVHYLLTSGNIRSCIDLYYHHWYPSGPIVHRPSFCFETAPSALLCAVFFMGAMYKNDRDLAVAKSLLDLAELYIYSSDVFAPEADMRRSIESSQGTDDRDDDWVTFQHFQAGLTIIVVQYWAGNLAARNRAMQDRFGKIISVRFPARNTSVYYLLLMVSIVGEGDWTDSKST